MISVIIRCKNERQYLSDVISAVLAQDDKEEFEIVVIDSGSTDGTQELVRSFPARLNQIPSESFSFGYALNLGARLAEGRLIAYLSGHCTPTTHYWLRELVEPLRTDSRLVATYGRQEPRKGLNPFEEQGLWNAFPADGSRPPAALFSNANCAIWRSVLGNYPFDEKLVSSEDLVWRSRFEPSQIRYVPRASVYHSHPLEFRYWARRFEQDGIAAIRMQHLHNIMNPYVRRDADFGATARDFLGGCLQQFGFFLSQKYYRFLPLIPAFEAMRAFCLSRGLRKGQATLAQ